MSAQSIPAFASTVHKTEQWVEGMQTALDWPATKQEAYHALRAGLHFLRDRITVDEVANLSAQLPMLLRGIYYEGWHPADKPLQVDTIDGLADYLVESIDQEIKAEPASILTALFEVLEKHVTPGELEDVKAMLPDTFQPLWANTTSA